MEAPVSCKLDMRTPSIVASWQKITEEVREQARMSPANSAERSDMLDHCFKGRHRLGTEGESSVRLGLQYSMVLLRRGKDDQG